MKTAPLVCVLFYGSFLVVTALFVPFHSLATSLFVLKIHLNPRGKPVCGQGAATATADTCAQPRLVLFAGSASPWALGLFSLLQGASCPVKAPRAPQNGGYAGGQGRVLASGGFW